MDIDENAPGNQSQQAVTRTTDNETGHDPKRENPEVPLPPDDEAPVEEDMSDVDASTDSVLSSLFGNSTANETKRYQYLFFYALLYYGLIKLIDMLVKMV